MLKRYSLRMKDGSGEGNEEASARPVAFGGNGREPGMRGSASTEARPPRELRAGAHRACASVSARSGLRSSLGLGNPGDKLAKSNSEVGTERRRNVGISRPGLTSSGRVGCSAPGRGGPRRAWPPVRPGGAHTLARHGPPPPGPPHLRPRSLDPPPLPRARRPRRQAEPDPSARRARPPAQQSPGGA